MMANSQQAMPAGGAVRVNCERGNITVNNWDQPQVKVVYHKRIFAGSQSEADSTNRATSSAAASTGDDRRGAGQYGRRGRERGCVRPRGVCSAEGGCGADGTSRRYFRDPAHGRSEGELAARGRDPGSGDGKRKRHNEARITAREQCDRKADGGRTAG